MADFRFSAAEMKKVGEYQSNTFNAAKELGKLNQKKKSGRMSLRTLTTAEKKKVKEYNFNIFNPTEELNEPGEASAKPKSSKRYIIIDGTNVAFAHGKRRWFSSEGIKYCLQYFEKMGHTVKVVMPSYRRHAFKCSQPQIIEELYKENKIVFTPCKNLPGLKAHSYEGRFCLQLAYELNARVVSNDSFGKVIEECPHFKKIVRNRVLKFKWFNIDGVNKMDPSLQKGKLRGKTKKMVSSPSCPYPYNPLKS